MEDYDGQHDKIIKDFDVLVENFENIESRLLLTIERIGR